MIEEMETS